MPVSASSGAGSVEHFSGLFAEGGVKVALVAGIIFRKEIHDAALNALQEKKKRRGRLTISNKNVTT
jgi:glutamine amidotransferase/cyclase